MSVYRSEDGATRVKNRIVGQMIRELRLKSGLSQTTLGEKTGLSRFVIRYLENGIRSLKDDEARILEQAFDLEEHYFDSTSHYLKRVKTGDAGNVEKYPINDDLLEWLQNEESIRKSLWECMERRMDAREDGIDGSGKFVATDLELKDDAQIRYEAIRAVETKQMTVTEACETFGFSRETYYKYKRAYDADGIAGLIMEHKGPWGHRSSDETDEHRSKQPM